MDYYLLNLTMSGIKNIKEKIHLDFYKKTVDKKFDPSKYKIKAIYGENGSGKTAIVTAVQILKQIISEKNYLSDNQNQQFLNEIINKEINQLYLECEVLVDRTVNERLLTVLKYIVELGRGSDDNYEILREQLSYKKANYMNHNYKTIYRIEKGNINELGFSSENSDLINRASMNLLSFESMVSCFLYQNIYNKISMEANRMRVLDLLLFSLSLHVYLNEEDKHTLYMVKKLRERMDNGEFSDLFWNALDRHIDNYISVSSRYIKKDYLKEYENRINKLYRFIKIFKPDLRGIIINKKEVEDVYLCNLVMAYDKYKIDVEFESTGICKLIRLYDCFNNASRGEIVFIDELDSNINAIYFCKLIEYFMFYGSGQLCFTTHNLDPMNILKENKLSIDFLSNINTIRTWTTSGNASPENYYKNGMIEDIPFNVDATDFIGLFEEE